MFKLDPSPTFTCTVQITEPGGTHRPLKVVFRHRTKSQFHEWRAKQQTDLEDALDMIESVPELEEGVTLKDFLEKLLENYPAAALDLFLTYHRELFESRAKN